MRTELDRALETVRTAGYVTVKAKSHAAARERLRVANALHESEERAAESARAWALDCLNEQRRLADRLTFVYGVARAHGATVEELSGA